MPPLAVLGLFLGAVAWILSVTGLLVGISELVVLAAILLAALCSAWVGRDIGVEALPPTVFWLLAIPLLILPAVMIVLPPFTFDEVAYGVALPRDYAAARRFLYNDDYGFYSAFPSNYEALTTASLLLTGAVWPMKLLNIIQMVALGLSAAWLGEALGVDRRRLWIPPLLVLSSVALWGLAIGVKNDLLNALFHSLSVVCFVRYLARPSSRMIMASAAFLGLAIGTKYSSLQFAVCFAASAAVAVRLLPSERRRPLVHAAQFVGVCAIVAAPWYARNAVVFANPFFPMLEEYFAGHPEFTGLHLTILREMMSGLIDFSWTTGSPLVFAGKMLMGLGPVVMLLGVVGAAASIRSREPASRFLLLLFASFGLVTLRFGYWLPRYVLVLLVIGAAFSGVAVERLLRPQCRSLPRRARFAFVVLAVCLTMVASVKKQVVSLYPLAHTYFRYGEDTFMRHRVADYGVAGALNLTMSDDDRVAIGVNLQPFFYLRKPYLHVHPLTEKGNLQAARSADELRRAFELQGITFVAVRRWQGEKSIPRSRAPQMHGFLDRYYRFVRELARDGELEPVARVANVQIYRLRIDDTLETP